MNLKTDKEYTPIPFWFWNDELTEEEIFRQMKEMKDKGVDGFVIHPRKGLPDSIGYLSDAYFHFVKYAVRKAKELDMIVVLYDEAMYPSGSCHGEVVRSDPSFASKGLLRMTEKPARSEGTILAEALENGEQIYYVLAESGGTIRGVHPGEDDGEAGAPRSADLLNPAAVRKFIELTHERYYRELSPYFGDTIRGFFTDEPNILGRNARRDMIPWTKGLLEEFLQAGGTVAQLHFLFEETGKRSEQGAFSQTRQIYQRVLHKRLGESYYKQLSAWCFAHHIDLTGHPEKSTDIGYLQYFQAPCQDIVWRFVEPEDGHAIEGEHSTMGKCSSDSARHRGKRRNGNECFGCCGQRQDPKRFTEEDMCWYLNWLFVRGVNLVYPHAFYYSIREDRGDERPPEVGLHNPFWPNYRKMSAFIKRMCYLNTDSVNHAPVAVLCGEETLSWKIAKPLYAHQIEFNYLEADLLSACRVENGQLRIASQSYGVLLAEPEEYAGVDASAQAVLKMFENSGGTIRITDGENLNLSALDVRRELHFSGETDALRCSHVTKEGKDYLIVTNEGLSPITVFWENGSYRVTEIYDPYEDQSILPDAFQKKDREESGILSLPPFSLKIFGLERSDL
ncbi:MAG: hypothetical protein K6A92_04375 [Lachnospiraceae bacterium]|nr:hypothetical protein [Lachnospiraceae bacterium]